MIINCRHCGVPFSAKPSAVKKGKKYCSKACYDAAQFRGEVKQCFCCGKEIRVSPSLVRERNFCSNDCRTRWLSAHMKIEDGHGECGNLNFEREPKQTLFCEVCGRPFKRYPSGISEHNFCSRECAKYFTSKRMTDYNRQENPMNTSEGWNDERREASRTRMKELSGECKPDTYPKKYGRHEHRRIAEEILGRPLRPGEVVHHIDHNKHNNSPDNLMIFASQGEHSRWHRQHDKLPGKGGDAV